MDWSPILISMKTASLSIFITFFIGLFAAWAVVSLKNETLKVICDGILTLPLVLPPTVAGFFLLYLFGVKRPIGQFFIEYFSVKIAFSWIATVLAAVTMSFPLMYRSAQRMRRRWLASASSWRPSSKTKECGAVPHQ